MMSIEDASLSSVLEGSACAFVTHTDDKQSVSLYAFGGILLDSMAASDTFVHTQLHLPSPFDAENRGLSHVMDSRCCKTETLCPKGERPQAPVFGTLSLLGNRLYLFGGHTDQWSNAFFYFDMVSKEWHNISLVEAGPSPRDKHCAAALNSHQLVVFGGFGPGGGDVLSDDDNVDDEDSDEIDRLSRKHNQQQRAAACFTWFNDLFIYDTEKKTWCEQDCAQLRPTPRAAATLTRVKQGLILFGGRDAVGRCNDVFRLESTASAWTALITAGTAPSPRSFHAACALHDGLFLAVSGGRLADDSLAADLHILDLTTCNWTRIESSSCAVGRVCHVLFASADWLIEAGGAMDYDPESMICQRNAPQCVVYCAKTLLAASLSNALKGRHSEDNLASSESSPKKTRLDSVCNDFRQQLVDIVEKKES